MADKMSIDKKDPTKDDSEDSVGSSPEGEPGPASNSNAAGNAAQENQQPKRKGGRKPIYATSEERKQRNRQAQAAFRERRTEYIKQLEETIRVHEQNLHNLQAAHRHAADECLMLRYKNSLLERILLEKGIDVQAELRAKTGSPNLGPTHMPQNLVQPPPIPRAILNRHHARRSASSIAPKVEPGMGALPPPLQHPASGVASPKNRPTPSSHSASPTATNSVFGTSPAQSGSDPTSAAAIRPGMPPTTAPMKPHQAGHMANMGGMPQQPAPRQMQPHMQAAQQAANMRPSPNVSNVNSAAAYYPTPAFQNHIEQLGKLTQQEYDAAADLMEDQVDQAETPSGPGPYPGGPYSAEAQHIALSSPATTAPPGDGSSAPTPHGNYPSMTQLLDPGIDWDPFGLSASMAFPTQFSFDTSNMR